MIEDFLWSVAEKVGSIVFACASVCLSVQAFWHLEDERLGRSGRGKHYSTCRNSGKTLVPIADRLVARGTSDVPMCQRFQKSCSQCCRPNQWTDTTQTSMVDGHYRRTKSVGEAMVAPLHSCGRYVISDFINLLFAHERRV